MPPEPPVSLRLGAVATSTAKERDKVISDDIVSLKSGTVTNITSKENTYSGPRGSGTFTIHTKILNGNLYQKSVGTGPQAEEFSYDWK